MVEIDGCAGTLEIALKETPTSDGGSQFKIQRDFLMRGAETCPSFMGATGSAGCADIWLVTVAPLPH
jgi:hypothetical protein